MKVNVEDVSSVKKIMHVEIPEDEVARELGKAYKTLKNTVKLKGFRPGKVPLSLLEKRFKKEVQAQVSGELLQGSYGEALKEADLKPVGDPELDQPVLEKGKPFRYSATIEVFPPIDDLDLEGLELDKHVHAVGDEEVETQLKVLQKRSAQLRTVQEERPVKENDTVIIDYEGFKDGKPFEFTKKTENFQLQLGAGQVLEDFSKQLEGMSAGNAKEFPVRFPDDYYNKDLAGLEITFKVALKEIKEEVLPELDDEFAKDLGTFETLDMLKEAVRKELESAYEKRYKNELRQVALAKLLEQVDCKLPDSLVQAEIDAMVERAERHKAEQDKSPDGAHRSQENLRGKYQAAAEKKVQEYLVVQKIIEQEQIELTEEYLDKAYEELGQTLNQPVETFKKFHSTSKEAYEIFRQRALEKLALETVIENSQINEIQDLKGSSGNVEAAGNESGVLS